MAISPSITPIHVDIGAQTLTSELRWIAAVAGNHSFASIAEAAKTFDCSKFSERLAADHDQILQEWEGLKDALGDEAKWGQKYTADWVRRAAADPDVALLIKSHMKGDPAIIIYGRAHLNWQRANSLSSALERLESVNLEVYHIVGDRLVFRPKHNETEAAHDSEAMLKIAKQYYHGIDSVRDPSEARHWLIKASAHGSAEADYYLALCSFDCWDFDRSFSFVQKSADKGFNKAFSFLGHLYHTGFGVSQSDASSHEWYVKAAEAGDLSGSSTIAYNFFTGCGVAKNVEKSYFWYSIAATLNDQNAIDNIKFAERQLTPETMRQIRREALDWMKEHQV